MTIDAISFLPSPSGLAEKALFSQISTGVDFSDWFVQEIQGLSAQLNASDAQLQDLALGKAENLHQVMMSMEKAKLTFELAMQVRNKVLDAYHDVMRMQI